MSRSEEPEKRTRKERDLLGEREVPASAYYGVQTLRALENFPVSGVPNHRGLVRAYAAVKKAAAGANHRLDLLDGKRFKAISTACDEIMSGEHGEHFPVDVFQAGAGTSTNMNMNEVIANRALEIMGESRGDYDTLHPNDHVNMGQSTNDTFPTAMHVALLAGLPVLLDELGALEKSFAVKAKQHRRALKSARTHLQDGVPVRWGQVFDSYRTSIRTSKALLESAKKLLREVALGGTAAGTGLNTHPEYRETAVRLLSEFTGLELKPSRDMLASMNSHIAVANFSSTLRNAALELIRIANDLRLLSSGPLTGLAEISLPAVQPGSSIMPGKVNPVMAEMLDMVCFRVIGVDSTVAMAVQAGQLELNVMMPIMANELLGAVDVLAAGIREFRTRCIDGLEVDEERGEDYAFRSPSIATVLNRVIGYERAGKLVKKALREKKTVLEVLGEEKTVPEDLLKRMFDPFSMTSPGLPEREGEGSGVKKK